MATAKKKSMRNLPKRKKSLTAAQAKNVKGGAIVKRPPNP
jgi:hypothetical protein